MPQQLRTALRLLSIRTFADRIDRGVSTVYLYLDPASRYFKPSFPRPVRLGGRIGFLEHEVEAYIAALTQQRDQVLAEQFKIFEVPPPDVSAASSLGDVNDDLPLPVRADAKATRHSYELEPHPDLASVRSRKKRGPKVTPKS